MGSPQPDQVEAAAPTLQDQRLFDLVPTEIAFLDSEFRLLHCNTAMSALLVRVGLDWQRQQIPPLFPAEAEEFRQLRRTLVRKGFWQGVFLNIGAVQIKQAADCFSGPEIIHYALTITDCSEALNLRAELTRERTLVVESNKSKSEVLSQMSHELRTPLNAIVGFTQLLQMDSSQSEEQSDYLNEITSASQYLLGLINKILRLSKIEHEGDGLATEREQVDLDALMADCRALIQPLADKSKISLQVNACGIAVHSDSVRIKQVMMNLLSNAIKYNSPGGKIIVNAFHADANYVQIEVQDTGLGIPSTSQEHLFNPFERLGKEVGSTEGSGVGLMITRRIVKNLGGGIGVISDPGCGSVFVVKLPVDLDAVSEDISSSSKLNVPVLIVGNLPQSHKLALLRPSLDFSAVQDLTEAFAQLEKSDQALAIVAIDSESLSEATFLNSMEKLLNRIPVIAVIDHEIPKVGGICADLKFAAKLTGPAMLLDLLGELDGQLI